MDFPIPTRMSMSPVPSSTGDSHTRDEVESQARSILDPTERHAVERILVAMGDSRVQLDEDLPVENIDTLVHAQSKESALAASCVEHASPMICMDPHGQVIFAYHPSGLARIPESRVAKHLQSAAQALMHKPDDDDQRYGDINKKVLDAMHDEDCWGVFDAAVWCDRDEEEHLKLPYFSDRMLLDRNIYATAEFARDTLEVRQQLSIFYAAVSPVSWRLAVDRVRKLEKYFPASGILTTAEVPEPWSGAVTAINLPQRLFREPTDSRDHLSALFTINAGPGNEVVEGPVKMLVVPYLKRKFPLSYNSAVLLNSSRLPFFLRRCVIAERDIPEFNVLFYNSQTVFDWVEERMNRRGSL
jgi:hypothetical protein